jgi:hypothetical protein
MDPNEQFESTGGRDKYSAQSMRDGEEEFSGQSRSVFARAGATPAAWLEISEGQARPAGAALVSSAQREIRAPIGARGMLDNPRLNPKAGPWCGDGGPRITDDTDTLRYFLLPAF